MKTLTDLEKNCCDERIQINETYKVKIRNVYIISILILITGLLILMMISFIK